MTNLNLKKEKNSERELKERFSGEWGLFVKEQEDSTFAHLETTLMRLNPK